MSSVEAKLASMTISNPHYSDVLENLSRRTAKDMVAIDMGERPKSSDEARIKIAAQILQVAVRTLAEALKKDQLAAALAPLNINHKEVGNNPNSKRVLYKRFLEKVSQAGIAKYMIEHVEADLLLQMLDAFELKPKSKTDVEAMAKQLEAHLEYEAMYAYFESFEIGQLHDFCFDMKLEDALPETSNKHVLIEALMTKEKVKKIEKNRPKREAPEIKISKKKYKIQKGVTYDDIFQHYSVEEIRKWCKKNKLLVSGTKKELIERILAFLDGDKENTLADVKRKHKPRKKSEETKKREARKKRLEKLKAAKGEGETQEEQEEVKSPKKTSKPVVESEEDEPEEEPAPKQKASTTKKSNTKSTKEPVEEAPQKKSSKPAPEPEEQKPVKQSTKAVKKTEPEPEPVQEEEAPAEEQSDEDEDFDLDNLGEYTLKQLKKYCTEEGVEVHGNKKQDYIDAILKYNEDQEESDNEQ